MKNSNEESIIVHIAIDETMDVARAINYCLIEQ